MRTLFTALLCVAFSLAASAAADKAPPAPDFRFDKTISRAVLDNFLDRSITMEGLFNGRGDFDDNIRMLKNMGTKFVGRSICLWAGEANLIKNFERAGQLMPKARQALPDTVFQACIFEIVTTQVDQVPIPDWAFAGVGMPAEKRNFRYQDMLYTNGKRVGQWGRNGSVPDVSRPETQLYFYFLARSYIDLGFEAIHFGQMELMNANDKGLDHYAHLFGLVRGYAAEHARRHMLLCDAHVPSGGLVREGKLLLDFHSFPARIMENPAAGAPAAPKARRNAPGAGLVPAFADNAAPVAAPAGPQPAILKIGFTDAIYRRSKGGVSPSGWTCEHLPYLVELDNYGSSRTPGKAGAGGIWVYGYDEITWFAQQPEAYRNDWLRYAVSWVRQNDPDGHLQMPGSRTLRSPLDNKRWYYANKPSPATPEGFNQEEAIRAIWNALPAR